MNSGFTILKCTPVTHSSIEETREYKNSGTRAHTEPRCSTRLQCTPILIVYKGPELARSRLLCTENVGLEMKKMIRMRKSSRRNRTRKRKMREKKEK